MPGRFIFAEELLVSARNSSIVSSPGGRAGMVCHWRFIRMALSCNSSVANRRPNTRGTPEDSKPGVVI